MSDIQTKVLKHLCELTGIAGAEWLAEPQWANTGIVVFQSGWEPLGSMYYNFQDSEFQLTFWEPGAKPWGGIVDGMKGLRADLRCKIYATNLQQTMTAAESALAQLLSPGSAPKPAADPNQIRIYKAVDTGQRLLITYTNEIGERTRREITVHGIRRAENGAILVDAFCHLRNEERSFRLERIREVTEIYAR